MYEICKGICDSATVEAARACSPITSREDFGGPHKSTLFKRTGPTFSVRFAVLPVKIGRVFAANMEVRGKSI